MRLTKHRGTFNLEMSSEEVNNLAFLLKSYQMHLEVYKDRVKTPTTDHILGEYLQELTKYQQEAVAYDKYLATFEE